ncbi:uncharacterized protein MELLADRAFT_104273 [Melampsora larici-populina 98AG31]|uniref:Secreted protein n=1 Tax=Melampsora larici-populina (strain 98AG31 / pathotype 3-4-7) TaxID=747676 RepID=F4RE63_MELLP|nr:uncharacterized protein MELLADRAFT_104273 [Melampsora larici-populina 98AG31]EGG09326.1 hypothetical protein MELLADRAFT_104273 [Melampsora larici-populina 98AG31]
MFFTRSSIFLCFTASSYAVPAVPGDLGLLNLDRHLRAGAIQIDHVEPQRIEPESIVTYRWDGENPDSYRVILTALVLLYYLSNADVFLPLATSLLDKIRSQTVHRVHTAEDHEKYSTPEDLLSLLVQFAKPPAKSEANKAAKSEVNKAAKSQERKPWTLSNDRQPLRQAKDVQLANNAQRLPIELQLGILKQVPHIESLSKLFMTLKPTDQLREMVWQEIQLLTYFSQVDREVFRNLYRDPRNDDFLHAVVKSHTYDCQEARSRAWFGGMTIVPISLSDELAKRIVPTKLSWLADYYQDYDRLLNEGHGELKERLDRFFFINVMSNSANTPRTLASRLTTLPTGWWLDSSSDLMKGEVRQLVEELIKSVDVDYDKVVTGLNRQKELYTNQDLPGYQRLSPELSPAFKLDGGVSSIFARFQAAQHLCKYLKTDFDRIFETSSHEPTRVYDWLRALSTYWLRQYDMEIVAHPRRFIHLTN